ncbi:DUF2461 domain-containing protein [Niabella terrae]
MIQAATLSFLKKLKKNNNKAWFDRHRSDYEAAKADFASLVDTVIAGFGKKDPAIAHLKAKDCMFRINRDIRFSKDKTPYKTNFGAFINAEGKKSMTAGYYLHLEPGRSFAGGGMWHPPAPMLTKVRQEIDYNLTDFEKILLTKSFKKIYGGLDQDEGYLLVRVPKGYAADNPAAAYLRFKSYVATAALTDHQLTEKGLVKQLITTFETLQPLNQFLNQALQ